MIDDDSDGDDWHRKRLAHRVSEQSLTSHISLRWVAYHSNESGAWEINVRAVRPNAFRGWSW